MAGSRSPVRNCYSLLVVSKPTRQVFKKDADRCTFSWFVKILSGRRSSKDREKIQKYGIESVGQNVRKAHGGDDEPTRA